MSGPDYGVRVLHAYENKRVGRVIFPAGVEREKLVRAKLAAPVPKPGSPEWQALPASLREDLEQQLKVHKLIDAAPVERQSVLHGLTGVRGKGRRA